MRPHTNRDILIKTFWEHAQFGWRSQEFMVNRSVGYRFYRNMVAELTQKSLAMMTNPQERGQVEKLLKEKYGVDLMPSETALGFPSDPAVGDLESWQPAFDRLKVLYGKEVSVSRRTGKDLRKYKATDGLLREKLQLVGSGEYTLRGLGSETSLDLVVHFQEFPREHLYRIESDQQTVLEFDDWPLDWSRT